MIDVLVVGGGLSGLFAACLTSRQNMITTLVMRGRGGLTLSHGAVELFSRSSPSRSIAKLDPPHPFALAGFTNLSEGIKAFLEITGDEGLPFEGGRSTNRHILTATGDARRVAYIPSGYLAGDPKILNEPISLGAFSSLRDFQAHYLHTNPASAANHVEKVVELPLLHPFSHRDLYPQDAARMFDDLEWTVENARAWKPHLVGARRLGLPAVLGIENHLEALTILEDTLSIPVFEIPTLPPSVPGLRLELALRRHAERNGTRIIEGPTATGRAQRQRDGVQVAGALLDGAGRRFVIDSRSTILATGSFLHGGLRATQDQRVLEPVFNLPVRVETTRADWIESSIYDPQPYARMGLSVNESMQPLDVHGDPMFENLYAIGGIIGGADRTFEGSRQGIDIATAFCAVNHLQRCLS